MLFPYTRLVHAITYPLAYLWRPYQVVLWNRRVAGSQPVTVRQADPRRKEES